MPAVKGCIALALAALCLPGLAWGWSVEESGARFTFFDQQGRGHQSQAEPDADARGSEALRVYQGIARGAVRQSSRWLHTATLTVDVVSSASADALDLVSTASRWNEAGGLDMASQMELGPDDRLTLLYGGHVEETLYSVNAGAGYQRELAADNASVDLSLKVIHDWFDRNTFKGTRERQGDRQTLSANLRLSQILSPTTLGSLGYGGTYQQGTLEQTWNSVPVACPEPSPPLPCPQRVDERFPDDRLRHALSAIVSQRLPPLAATLRLSYRYYRDDFGVQAHSGELRWYQDLGTRLRARLHYRHHRQNAVDFFTSALSPAAVDGPAPRTADSDLAAFTAREYGALLSLRLGRDSAVFRHYLEAGAFRYRRSNDLVIDAAGLSYRRSF